LIEAFVVDVDDLAAMHADQVVMATNLAVKPACCPCKVNSTDHSQFQKSIQRSVYGRPRELRDTILHRLVNLVCRGMIVPLQNGFQDHTPLQGHGKPLLAASLLELSEPCGDLFVSHFITRW
jgi:hypothetical protein